MAWPARSLDLKCAWFKTVLPPWKKGDFRASRLLEAIVLSYPFSHRNQKE